MSQIAEAYVQIIPTTKGIGNGIANEFSGVGTAAGGAFGGGLVATAGKFVAPLLAAFGAIKVADFFGNAISGGSTLNESLNAISVSYGAASDEIAKLGETAAKRLGVSNKEFNALSVRFSAFAKTIVGDGGDVVGLIDELTTRGADFASVFDLEVSEALQLFQSGLAGETEPLRRYGLDLSAAAVEAYALSKGIWDGTGAMSESEKVQARYGALLEQTAQVEGDRANTADSYANAQRTLNAVLQDTSDRIGIALLPALETLLPQLTDTVEQFVASPEFNQFIADLGTNFSNLLQFLPGALENLQSFGKDALPAISAFFPMLNEALELLGSMFFGIQNTDPSSSTNNFASSMNGLATAFNAVAGAIDSFNDSYNKLPSFMKSNIFTQIEEFGRLILPGPSGFQDRWKSSSLNPWAKPPSTSSWNGPKLADGGTISRPGQVMVGEEGPEILQLNRGASVIPLDRNVGSSSQPIYTDGGTLVGWMRTVANGQARLVWATNDLQNAVMV